MGTIEMERENVFPLELFAMLTIETGLAYFYGFIPEKKILWCVIPFSPQSCSYKGRLWILTYFAKNTASKKYCSLENIWQTKLIQQTEIDPRDNLKVLFSS